MNHNPAFFQLVIPAYSLVFGLDLKYFFQHPYFHSAATSGGPSVNMIA